MKYRQILAASICISLLSGCVLAPGGHGGGRGGPGMPGGGHGGGHGGGGINGAIFTLGVGIMLGAIIASLPDNHVHVQGSIYYADGVFYRHGEQGYVVIEAPVGVWVDDLPPKHQVERVNEQDYFVSQGTWYRFDSHKKRYQVVAAPR